jgi:predicted nuclease with TOPRIM domain
MSNDKSNDNRLPEPIPHPKLVEEVQRLREENKRLYKKLGQVMEEKSSLHQAVEELEMCMNMKDQRILDAVRVWRDAKKLPDTVWPGMGELLAWMHDFLPRKN